MISIYIFQSKAKIVATIPDDVIQDCHGVCQCVNFAYLKHRAVRIGVVRVETLLKIKIKWTALSTEFSDSNHRMVCTGAGEVQVETLVWGALWQL